MHITYDDLRRLCPRGDAAILAEIVRLAPELLPRYGITTPRRWCHLVAQLAHESQGFTRLTENLNYSAEGLRETFPKYFTAAEAAAYARQPERIASRVYGGRMGNGPERTGDGWRYRGRGLIMNTGKDGYARIGTVLGIDLDAAPERLEDPAVAFEAALVFWRDRRINQYADVDDTGMVTTIINGGLNGYDDRVRLLQLCFAIWGEGGSAPMPAANAVRTDRRPTLRCGDAGEAVRVLQQALNTQIREMDLRVAVDGQFGAGTEAALKAWQRIAGLMPDGICGAATWASLDNRTQSVLDSMPPPTPSSPVDAPDSVEPQPAPRGGLFHALRRIFG